MKKGLNLWTKEEILIAINLYHKLPFGQLHSRNKTIIKVAASIGRSSSSLALKLGNLASLDSSLNRKGMSNYSKLDKEVWTSFYDNLEDEVFESENLVNNLLITKDTTLEYLKETETIITIKQRVNQQFFRKSILSSYNNQCCISGVNIKSMLVASHIIPWNANKENRLNPSNGICFNSLYDKAFDRGLITIDNNYRIILSRTISENNNEFVIDNFLRLNGNKIILPSKFLPDKIFLKYHNDNIFIQ